MSRYKFEFKHKTRTDNIELLKDLSIARLLDDRNLSKIYLELCTRCPGNCRHCYFETFKNTKEFCYSDVETMLLMFHRNNVKSITYAGGDPILRDDIFDIIRLGKDLNLMQTFCTRGWINFLDKTSKLAESGVQHIQFSTDPTINDIKIEDECERIKLINAATINKGAHISWVVTLTKGVEKLLPKLCDAIYSSGGNEFRIHRVVPFGNILKHPELIPSNEEFENSMKEFTNYFFSNHAEGYLYAEECTLGLYNWIAKEYLNKTALIGCPIGQTALTIRCDGVVFLCPLAKDDKLKLTDNWIDIFRAWEIFRQDTPFHKSKFSGTVCGKCIHFDTCRGGCRCQAVANGYNVWDPDPCCPKVRKNG